MTSIPRYCPIEVPPALCLKECGMGPCERAVRGLQADVSVFGETVDGHPYTVNHTAFAELAKLRDTPTKNPPTHCGRCGCWLPDLMFDRGDFCQCTPDELSKFMAEILNGKDTDDEKPRIGIQSRVHKEDWTAYILANPGFSWLDIPGRQLADDDCEECCGDGLADPSDEGERVSQCGACKGTGKSKEAIT